MKKFFIVLLAISFLAGCAAQQTKPCLRSAALHEKNGITSEADIAGLFDRWNEALQTGDPKRVVALYGEKSVLLPTLSNTPLFTSEEKEEYFRHFLEKGPSAKIDIRKIEISDDIAVDTGLYTFTFAKTGEIVKGRYTFVYHRHGTHWFIISHHSSLMPEKETP